MLSVLRVILPPYTDEQVTVRINPLDSPWGEEDLRAIAPLAPDAIVIPKVRSSSVSLSTVKTARRARRVAHVAIPIVCAQLCGRSRTAAYALRPSIYVEGSAAPVPPDWRMRPHHIR